MERPLAFLPLRQIITPSIYNKMGNIMNSSKLADYCEIVSSIAIVITLIFLVMQMQQNTEALQLQSSHASFSEDMAFLDNILENPDLLLSRSKEELTDAEKILLATHLTKYFRAREQEWLRYKSGSVDKITLDSYLRPLTVVLATQTTRTWWSNASEVLYDPEFVEEVNESMAEMPVNDRIMQLNWFD
jgi:hypothetical protein